MPISPPEVSPKRELARKLFDAIVSEIPLVGGAFAALYSVTHPAKGEVDETRWQADVSKLLNSLENAIPFLSNSIVLSEDAATIGKWIAEESKSGGRFDNMDFKNVKERYSDASENELLEALGELELEELVVLSSCIGMQVSSLRPTHKLFEIFDPIIFPNVSPREDAATVAKELLESDRGISAHGLCEKYGWDIRRINPAMAIVGEFIDEGRKRSPMGQPYIVRSMSINPSERAILRRFVNEVEGG